MAYVQVIVRPLGMEASQPEGKEDADHEQAHPMNGSPEGVPYIYEEDLIADFEGTLFVGNLSDQTWTYTMLCFDVPF